MPTASASTPALPTAIRGNYVVLGMFGVGLALGLFAWWWNLGQNRRCLDLWGHENVRLIRKAPLVELWQLKVVDGTEDDVETIEIDGQAYRLTNERDIAHARGLVHARYALTDDPSFDWSAGTAKSAEWQWAVRFAEAGRSVTLLIDTAGNRVRLAGTDQEAVAIPRIIAGWQALVKREVEAAQPIHVDKSAPGG